MNTDTQNPPPIYEKNSQPTRNRRKLPQPDKTSMKNIQLSSNLMVKDDMLSKIRNKTDF